VEADVKRSQKVKSDMKNLKEVCSISSNRTMLLLLPRVKDVRVKVAVMVSDTCDC
jgi:hypothetical protein